MSNQINNEPVYKLRVRVSSGTWGGAVGEWGWENTGLLEVSNFQSVKDKEDDHSLAV